MVNLRKHLRVRVTQDHISEAKCGDPNKCMIKMAVVDAVGKNCYCKVDMTGISITRRDDYREKAFLPRKAAKELIKFDARKPVQPFEFELEFVKATPIYQQTDSKRDENRERQRRQRAAGIPRKEYGKASRVAGIAVAGGSI